MPITSVYQGTEPNGLHERTMVCTCTTKKTKGSTNRQRINVWRCRKIKCQKDQMPDKQKDQQTGKDNSNGYITDAIISLLNVKPAYAARA
jgi:hypothetical protein